MIGGFTITAFLILIGLAVLVALYWVLRPWFQNRAIVNAAANATRIAAATAANVAAAAATRTTTTSVVVAPQSLWRRSTFRKILKWVFWIVILDIPLTLLAIWLIWGKQTMIQIVTDIWPWLGHQLALLLTPAANSASSVPPVVVTPSIPGHTSPSNPISPGITSPGWWNDVVTYLQSYSFVYVIAAILGVMILVIALKMLTGKHPYLAVALAVVGIFVWWAFPTFHEHRFNWSRSVAALTHQEPQASAPIGNDCTRFFSGQLARGEHIRPLNSSCKYAFNTLTGTFKFWYTNGTSEVVRPGQAYGDTRNQLASIEGLEANNRIDVTFCNPGRWIPGTLSCAR